jgi:hypothetical protein
MPLACLIHERLTATVAKGRHEVDARWRFGLGCPGAGASGWGEDLTGRE